MEESTVDTIHFSVCFEGAELWLHLVALVSRTSEGTTVRAGIERPVCVDDGGVCFAPALQRVNGSSMPALLYLAARRFNQTK